MSVIHSRLLKSAAFIESTYFRQMVQAAAAEVGVPYTYGLLGRAAADPDLLDGIALPVVEGVDATLNAMSQDPQTAATLDELVTAAVRAVRTNNPEGPDHA